MAKTKTTKIKLKKPSKSGDIDLRKIQIRHLPRDNSVSVLEAEELEHDQSAFDVEVLDNMACKSLGYLEKHYPELTFGMNKDKYATGKHEFKIRRSDGVIFADWRTADGEKN